MTAEEYAKKQSDLDRPVTLGLLLEFTDEFLIPRFSELMDQRIDEKVPKIFDARFDAKIGPALAKLEYNLKTYIDDKMADYTSDIFKRLEKRTIKDREFKSRIVDILKRNKLAKDEELSFLQGLVEGSY